MVKRTTGKMRKQHQQAVSTQTVIEQLVEPTSKPPWETLPSWLLPPDRKMNGMDVRKYAETFGLAIHLDSLKRSTKGDTAAHAKWREQALKGLGLGQRTELDITGRSDDAWLKYLTDAELQALETLHTVALQRMNAPQSGIISEKVQAVCNHASTGVHMLSSDNEQSVKFSDVAKDTAHED